MEQEAVSSDADRPEFSIGCHLRYSSEAAEDGVVFAFADVGVVSAVSHRLEGEKQPLAAEAIVELVGSHYCPGHILLILTNPCSLINFNELID